MCGISQTFRRLLRGGAACLLAVSLLGMARIDAVAAEKHAPAERMLVPVGHTVGIKLFSKGVLVVKPPESRTPFPF